jgi:hypothetical protein
MANLDPPAVAIAYESSHSNRVRGEEGEERERERLQRAIFRKERQSRKFQKKTGNMSALWAGQEFSLQTVRFFKTDGSNQLTMGRTYRS